MQAVVVDVRTGKQYGAPEAEQTEPAVGPARHRVRREPTEGGAETTDGRAKARGANDA